MSDRVRITREYVEKAMLSAPCMEQAHRRYRLEHTLRVAALGRELAAAEGMDAEALETACLLHDIAYAAEVPDDYDWGDHGNLSAKIARPFIKTLGFAPKTEEQILYGMAIHTGKADFEGEDTPFAESVGDCDNIDRFDAYRIYDTLMREDFQNMENGERIRRVKARIERLKGYVEMKFATSTATLWWRDRVGFQLEFYSRLLRQLESGE